MTAAGVLAGTRVLRAAAGELRQAQEDLARARRLHAVSQARIARRLRVRYVSGAGQGTLEVLLGARSLDDLVAGLEATQRIAAQDAAIARQAAIVARLAAEKRAIEQRLAERRRLLVSVQDEVARLQESERRRTAELRRRAELELERQRRAIEVPGGEEGPATAAAIPPDGTPADDLPGSSVSPPDPVESAQATGACTWARGVL